MTIAGRRGRPSPEVSKQKLDEILAVARDEFSRRGYRAVTMRGVAENAQVSTRTLYNRYADKLSLFNACLDVGAIAFPRISSIVQEDPAVELRRFAAAMVETLTTDSSLRISKLVYREGADFPELVGAAEANQERYLVEPLAAFLEINDLAGGDPREDARLFNAMAASQWQRAVLFGHPIPTPSVIKRHSARVVEVFLNGMYASKRNAELKSA